MPALNPTAWAAPPPAGVRRYVPIVSWLPAYDRRNLRFDAIAGATIWGLLVPEMIAYAGLAGLPPQAGLYTLLVTLAAYAVFGTPLFYANASLVVEAVKRLAGASDPLPRAIVLDFSPNANLDITSSEKLGELVIALRSAGIDFAVAELRKPTREAARRSGVLEAIGEDHVFHTIDEAVVALADGDHAPRL